MTEEKEFIGEYEVHCFEYDSESCWTEDYNGHYEDALERFNWITSRGGLYRNEYTGKATYCDKVILYEKQVDEYGELVFDERDELEVWEKVNEETKLTQKNTGSKEEKMTTEEYESDVESVVSIDDDEEMCSLCNAQKNLCLLTDKETGHQQVLCRNACDDNPASEFYEEEEEEQEEVCPECGIVLGEDVPIMCYMNKKEGDSTLCYNCYWDCKYYEDDENEDNEEEIKEYKEQEEEEEQQEDTSQFKKMAKPSE